MLSFCEQDVLLYDVTRSESPKFSTWKGSCRVEKVENPWAKGSQVGPELLPGFKPPGNEMKWKMS